MGKTRTLLEFRDLSVEVETTPGRELVDHMYDTILGTPGGLRYRHLDLEDRLRAAGENYFMYLRKSGKMMGSVGFVGRHSQTAGVRYDGWMIRYFSIKAPLRATPTKRKEKADLKDENKRTSVLGRFIQPVFAYPGQLREAAAMEDEAKDPSLIYALIESKNLRSMNFSSQMGLETISQVATFPFSRLRPRKSRRMEQLMDPEGREEFRALLKEYYAGYNLYSNEPLYKNNDYFVIREGDRILAGVQTWKVRWKVESLGSQGLTKTVRAITRLPWINKRVNLDELRLLAFDQVYCAPGHEDALYELMEAVLERKKVYLGMLMMDVESELYGIFKRKMSLGILYKAFGEFTAELRARFNHMPEEAVSEFRSKPVFIPTYDNS